MRLKSLLTAVALAAALVLWMASGTLVNGHAEAPPPGDEAAARRDRPVMTVAVRALEARPVERLLTLQGELQPSRRATLAAETAGRVVALPAARGAAVAAGEALVRLSLEDRRARLDQARARIERFTAEYEAAASLQERGLQAENQVKAAYAALQEARAELRRVELEIDHTTIAAPFDGVLEERLVELGEYVGPGDPVARVVDVEPLKVAVDVPQQQVGRVRLGQEGRVVLITGAERDARVSYIAPAAEAGTRTFAAELEVANPGRDLPAGMSAEVVLPVGREQGHFLSPAALALDADGRLGVKAVGEDDRVRFHGARVVRAEQDGVWLAGLPGRLRVITVGQGFVRPGDRVRPVPEAETPGLAPGAASPAPPGVR